MNGYVLVRANDIYFHGIRRKVYSTIKEACRAAINRKRKGGFDIYYDPPHDCVIQIPVMTWQAIKEFRQ